MIRCVIILGNIQRERDRGERRKEKERKKENAYIIESFVLRGLEGGVVDPARGLVNPATTDPLGKDGVSTLEVVDTGQTTATPLEHLIQLK